MYRDRDSNWTCKALDLILRASLTSLRDTDVHLVRSSVRDRYERLELQQPLDGAPLHDRRQAGALEVCSWCELSLRAPRESSLS